MIDQIDSIDAANAHPDERGDYVTGGAAPMFMGVERGDDEGPGDERGVATKTRAKTKKPSMYRVLLMNDDYTPMEFVVSVLMKIFNKSADEATKIMLAVHKNGIGVCGIFTFEVAETKVSQVMSAAQRAQHPLQCTMEKV
jgi:ATP-dependent Clp protease adaptor protein ClpS